MVAAASSFLPSVLLPYVKKKKKLSKEEERRFWAAVSSLFRFDSVAPKTNKRCNKGVCVSDSARNYLEQPTKKKEKKEEEEEGSSF
jgi:hypothetical protein